jgi:hypothetical protein
MSAFVVGFDHIDALVTAAESVRPRCHDSGLSWYTDDASKPGGYERHELGYMDTATATEVGRMLIRENVASVCFRYSDCEPDGDLPGTIGETDPEFYTFTSVNAYELPPETMAVTVIKLISCFEYQSCEHPGWKTSEAHAFCEALRHKMISGLPGYDDAPWGFSRKRNLVGLEA